MPDHRGAGQLNLLVIAVQFPFPPRSGGQMRVYQLLRQLAARHRVTLLSYATSQDRAGIAELSRHVRVRVVERPPAPQWAKRVAQLRSLASPAPFASREVHSLELQRAIDELCAQESFDVIQLEGSLLAGFDFPAGPTLILDEHNIEWEVFRRMGEGERSLARRFFNALEYRRFRRFEEAAWERVGACVVTSDREEPVINAAAPDTPTAVVPNAVDVEYFRPGPDGPVPRTLVFNGILDYRPNLDAAHHLVDQVWPLVRERCPDARLQIVGRSRTADVSGLRRPGVELAGEVDDLRPYLARAAVVAVPVRIGGGTRLKVVEALSMGKAIVSTSLGCEGIAVQDGRHLLIADDAAAFAAAIVRLFETPELAAALGDAARSLALARYTWDLAGEKLAALYRRLADPSSPEPPPAPRALVTALPSR